VKLCRTFRNSRDFRLNPAQGFTLVEVATDHPEGMPENSPAIYRRLTKRMMRVPKERLSFIRGTSAVPSGLAVVPFGSRRWIAGLLWGMSS